jgi:hypothetical protein
MEFTRIMNKNILLAGVLTASTVALAASTPAFATNGSVPGNPHTVPAGKVGICHATGSKTNPYVFIVVDKHAASAHAKHQDGLDVIGVTSADKCPKPATTGGQGGTTPTPTPKANENGQVLGNSTQPTSLPDTGAGLSALLGLPTLAFAGRAYLRSRLGQ